MASAERHREISEYFLAHAHQQLEIGDFLQASEKGWGAVAHCIKAIAREREWPNKSHRDVRNNALWLLELYGHEQASLMDGGRVKWVADGRPLTTDAPSVGRASYSASEQDASLRAQRDEVLAAVAARAPQLVDVRSPAEFTGEIISPPGLPETAQRGGHIPGAINVPWARAVNEDGTFRSADELREIYGGAGVSEGDPAIAYCRIGERSSHTWFVLKYLLGHEDVKNYDGSWTEYGSLIGVPIET